MRSAKDVLADYRYAKDRLRSKQDTIESLISDLTRTTASVNEVGIQQRGPLRDKLGDTIAEMQEAYENVVNASLDATESMEATMRLIEQAPQERWRLLLTLRYLEGCTWHDTAQKMGITERYARMMSDEALGILDAHLARFDGYSAEG